MTKKSRSSRRRHAVSQALLNRTTAVPASAAANLAVGTLELDEDLDRALQVIAHARSALLEAQAQLQAIERDSTDPAEQARAAVELLKVQRELELLEARRRLLVDGAATLKPPTDSDIQNAQRIADALAVTISGSMRVAAIVGLVADVVALSEKLVA